jgi:hypothetical protein
LKAINEADLIFKGDESPSMFLSRIREMYKTFHKNWKQTLHEPSSVVLLFMKTAASVYRCTLGIRRKDFWLLEDESHAWMSMWKMLGKNTYLCEQFDHVELVYDDECLDPIQQEVTRINRFPVLTELEDVVTYDWVNELYDCWLKGVPTTPYIDTAVMHSCHTIVKRNYANAIFYSSRSIRTKTGRSQYEEKLKIEMMLTKCNICITHEPAVMTNELFWSKEPKPTTLGSNKDKSKETSAYTPSEETTVLASTIMSRAIASTIRILMVTVMAMILCQ